MTGITSMDTRTRDQSHSGASGQLRYTLTKQTFGPYTFIRATHVVAFRGQRVALRPLEYDLALYLFENLGRVVPREELWEKLWQRAPSANMRSIDVHISRLRRLLKIPESNRLCLESSHGKGYRLLYFNEPIERRPVVRPKTDAEAA